MQFTIKIINNIDPSVTEMDFSVQQMSRWATTGKRLLFKY